MEKFVLSAKEAGEYLDIGECKIRDLCKSGEIKAARSGKNWKIPRPFLEEYILKKAEEGETL